MSKRGARRGRRRAWQQGGGLGKSKLPFPYSIFANVKLFYLVGIVAMVIALVAGVLVSFGGSSAPSSPPQEQSSSEAGDDSSAATPNLESEEGPRFKIYPAPPIMAIDPARRYIATIEMEKGAIRLELFPREAPQAVNNFVFLARDGFYNGLPFHYVRSGFVAMAGDPACAPDSGACSGLDGPGYSLPLEGSSLRHEAGALAMVADGAVSHGSLFYITYDDLGQQDGKDVVFGRVVEGMDVLRSLTQTNPRDPLAPPGDRIIRVTVQE